MFRKDKKYSGKGEIFFHNIYIRPCRRNIFLKALPLQSEGLNMNNPQWSEGGHWKSPHNLRDIIKQKDSHSLKLEASHNFHILL